MKSAGNDECCRCWCWFFVYKIHCSSIQLMMNHDNSTWIESWSDVATFFNRTHVGVNQMMPAALPDVKMMRCLSMEQLVWSDWRLRSSWRGGTGKPCYPQWLERRRWDRGLVGCSVTCNTAKSTNHSTLVTCNTTSAHPSDPPYYEGLFHCFQRLEWLQKKRTYSFVTPLQ